MTKKRKLILLEDTNVAATTKVTYGYYFKSLFDWDKKIKTQEGFLELSDDQLQDLMEGFVKHLKNRVKRNEISPNTIPKLFKPFKLLLDANYREHAVKWKPISIQYPPMEKRSGYKPWTTDNIQTFLKKCKNLKEEAAIHFQASTGSRVGVHDHPLLMKHVIKMETYDSNYHCYAILVYAEDDETIEEKDQRILNDEVDENDYSFFVFLTPEAAKALDDYHEFRRMKLNEKFTPNTPVFISINTHGLEGKGKTYQMTGNGFRKMFQDILDKTTVKRVKKRNRYDIMLDHGYRKRFNTILKIDNDINSNIAEKLMQHKKGLDGSYLTPTRQECFNEFVKAVPFLTVADDERQKIALEKKERELQEEKTSKRQLEKKIDEIKELQKKMSDLENFKEEIRQKFRDEMDALPIQKQKQN